MNQNLNGQQAPTMKEEAQRILSEVHNNEHRQTLRLYSLIHNCILLFVFLILFFTYPKWWVVLLFLWLWDKTAHEPMFSITFENGTKIKLL
jgi:hypothetical protein